jgi:hypothetical protein
VLLSWQRKSTVGPVLFSRDRFDSISVSGTNWFVSRTTDGPTPIIIGRWNIPTPADRLITMNSAIAQKFFSSTLTFRCQKDYTSNLRGPSLEMRSIRLLTVSLLFTHGVADSKRTLLRKPKRGVENENSSTYLHAAVGVDLIPDDTLMMFEAMIEEEMSLVTSAPTIETTSPPIQSPTGETSTSVPPEGGMTVLPSKSPSESPSGEGATRSPTRFPTFPPTNIPTKVSSRQPTRSPSTVPTSVPSVSPTTGKPSAAPSVEPTGTPSTIPTSSPTVVCNMSPETRESLMSTFIQIVSATEDVDEEGSPQNKAANWIINEDGARLCPQDDSFIQRYVMAVFYYSTNGNRWFQCRSPEDSGLSIPEANEACNITSLGNTSDAWLTPGSECMWGGVTCNSDQDFVEQIDFGKR